MLALRLFLSFQSKIEPMQHAIGCILSLLYRAWSLRCDVVSCDYVPCSSKTEAIPSNNFWGCPLYLLGALEVGLMVPKKHVVGGFFYHPTKRISSSSFFKLLMKGKHACHSKGMCPISRCNQCLSLNLIF